MAASEDTEITLGTGKMLVLFFGLVALCAVFFGMGFTLGRTSVKPVAAAEPTPAVPANAGGRQSAVKPTSASADLTFYKAVEQKETDAATNPAPEPATAPAPAPAAESSPTPAEPVAAPAANAYLVQVAAVTKQEDAQAL